MTGNLAALALALIYFAGLFLTLRQHWSRRPADDRAPAGIQAKDPGGKADPTRRLVQLIVTESGGRLTAKQLRQADVRIASRTRALLKQSAKADEAVTVTSRKGQAVHATALHAAATRNLPRTAREIIWAGADLNQRSASGQTPLAAAKALGYREMVGLLLRSGARPAAAARLVPAAAKARPADTQRAVKPATAARPKVAAKRKPAPKAGVAVRKRATALTRIAARKRATRRAAAARKRATRRPGTAARKARADSSAMPQREAPLGG